MVELHHLIVFLYAAVAVLALVVASIAWWRRTAPGGVSVAALMLGVAIWSGSAAVMWYVPTLGQQVFWQRMTGLGTWLVPVAFLTLAFDVARMERWRAPGRIALIAIVSFALDNAEWLNLGRLYEAAFVPRAIGPYTHFELVPGPLYWPFVVYAYALVVVSLVILVRVYLRSAGTARTQVAILIVGGLIPLIASAVTEAGVVPLAGLDLAPLAFFLTGALWLAAILRGTMLDVVPLARNALVEQMVDGVLVVDGKGHVADANPEALRMVDMPLAEVIGGSAEAVLAGVEGAGDILHDSGPRHAVLTMGSDGDSRYVELGITPLVVGLGRPPADLITLHDVTEERRDRERLELARTVFDTANEGIVVTRPDGHETIVDVNRAYSRLTGRSKEDTVGRDISRLQADVHSAEFYSAMEQTLFAEGEWRGEVWQARADGSVFPSLESLSVAEDDQENVSHVVRVFTDITEIKEAEEQLRRSATHDPLTGLPNRLLLDDRLEHALAHARRVGGGLAVLFMDLDGFKEVNDTFGHAQGDALLVEVAKRIVSLLRESDTAARLGGDEFAVVLMDIGEPGQVETAARRLLEAVALLHRVGAQDLHVTASVGAALFPRDGVDATALLRHADHAMYGAKGLGGNRVQFFSEQHDLNGPTSAAKGLGGADESGA